MSLKIFAIVALVILATLVFASVAFAGVSHDTIMAIIKDAEDGTLDGNWTAAEVNAALAWIKANPTYVQYSDVQGVLEDYLASLPSPGEQTGELKFTGGALTLLFGVGLGLMGTGLVLRRQRG
jgi:hypothetical protein